MKNDNRTVIWLKRLCFYTIFKMEMVLFKTSEHFMEMFPKRPELKLAILGDTSSMDGTTTIQKGPLKLAAWESKWKKPWLFPVFQP